MVVSRFQAIAMRNTRDEMGDLITDAGPWRRLSVLCSSFNKLLSLLLSRPPEWGRIIMVRK